VPCGIPDKPVTSLEHEMAQSFLSRDRKVPALEDLAQQVARNFLLNSDVKFSRKIREAILAIRIDATYSKPKILELYLNEIFLGENSYGVAAAALNYFDKSLDQLDIAETAFLAALPKSPSNYNPVRHHDAAVRDTAPALVIGCEGDVRHDAGAIRSWVEVKTHTDRILRPARKTVSIVKRNAAAHRPALKRSAKYAGNPAARILRCTSAIGYWYRIHRTRRASASYST